MIPTYHRPPSRLSSSSVVISEGTWQARSEQDIEVLHKTQSLSSGSKLTDPSSEYSSKDKNRNLSASTSALPAPTSSQPPPTDNCNKPLWLIAREQGIEYESQEEEEEDPGKVFFVSQTNKANCKTEYYMANARDIPGLPQPDSAEMEKPVSQLQMER